MIEYLVPMTADEIGALDDIIYYGGDHILSSWDESDYEPLLNLVWHARDRMKRVMEAGK